MSKKEAMRVLMLSPIWEVLTVVQREEVTEYYQRIYDDASQKTE